MAKTADCFHTSHNVEGTSTRTEQRGSCYLKSNANLRTCGAVALAQGTTVGSTNFRFAQQPTEGAGCACRVSCSATFFAAGENSVQRIFGDLFGFSPSAKHIFQASKRSTTAVSSCFSGGYTTGHPTRNKVKESQIEIHRKAIYSRAIALKFV